MIKKFNQFDNISIEDKSDEHYNFLSNYFKLPFTLEEFTNNDKIYIVTSRIRTRSKTNELIGVSLFKMSDGKIHLNYTVVDEKFRNTGVNTNIKEYIIKFANDNNISLITTNVRNSNTYSLKTFLNSGFKINDKYISEYPDGEKKIPLYLKL